MIPIVLGIGIAVLTNRDARHAFLSLCVLGAFAGLALGLLAAIIRLLGGQP